MASTARKFILANYSESNQSTNRGNMLSCFNAFYV